MPAIWFSRLTIVLWFFLSFGALEEWGLSDRWNKVFRMQFTISKQTTFYEKPLRDDGVIDYLGAVNAPLMQTPPASNAAVLLMNVRDLREPLVDPSLAEKYYKLLGGPRPNESSPTLDWSEDDAKELGKDRDDRGFELWNEAKCPKLAESLRRNERFLMSAVEASKRPKLEAPRVSNVDPPILEALILHHLTPIRAAAAMLTYRALLKADGSDLAGAYADLDACYRLGVLIARGERFLMEPLVGLDIVNRAARAESTIILKRKHGAPLHRERMRTLLAIEFGSFADCISKSERLLALGAVVHWGSYWKEHSIREGHKLPAVNYSHTKLLTSMLFDGDESLRTINRAYDRATSALACSDVGTRATKLKQWHDDILRMKATRDGQIRRRDFWFLFSHPMGVRAAAGEWLGDVMTLTYMPATQLFDNSHLFALIKTRMPAFAHALKAHKEEKGSFPKSLDEFDAELKKAIIDPANGKPFAYATFGRIAYFASVGRDGVLQAYVGPRFKTLMKIFPKEKDSGDDWTASYE